MFFKWNFLMLALCVFFTSCAAKYFIEDVDFEDLSDSSSEEGTTLKPSAEGHTEPKEKEERLTKTLVLGLREDKHSSKYNEPDVFGILQLLSLFASSEFLENPRISIKNDVPDDSKNIGPKYQVNDVPDRKNVRNRRQVDLIPNRVSQNENQGIVNQQNSNLDVNNQTNSPSNVLETNVAVNEENKPNGPNDATETNSAVANQPQNSNDDSQNQAASQNNDMGTNSAVTNQPDSPNNNDNLETFTLKNLDSDSQSINGNVATLNDKTNDLNVRNAEVDNFQNGNVTNDNNAFVNDTTASSLNSTVQSILQTDFSNSDNFALDNNINYNNSQVTDANNNEASDNNFKNQESGFTAIIDNFVSNNPSNDTSSNVVDNLSNNGFEIKEVFAQANDDVNEEYPIPEWKSGVDTLNNSQNYGDGSTSSEKPFQSESSDIINSNSQNSTEASDFQVHSSVVTYPENFQRAYNSEIDGNNSSYNNSEPRNDQSKLSVPLSLSELYNLQNVLKNNYGVNSEGSQSVANFQLNKTTNSSPVFVLVYNCSCNVGNQNNIEASKTENDNNNAELVITSNTRRMIPDNKNVHAENDENGLNISANSNSEPKETATNKPSNSFLENELLSRSLFAIQSESNNKHPDSDSFESDSNNSTNNQANSNTQSNLFTASDSSNNNTNLGKVNNDTQQNQQTYKSNNDNPYNTDNVSVSASVNKPEESNVVRRSDTQNNNPATENNTKKTQVDSDNSPQKAFKSNVEETPSNNNGNLENYGSEDQGAVNSAPSNVNVQNKDAYSQDNVQQREKRDINRGLIRQIRREKRDLFSSLNDALKSAAQVPAEGLQTILDKVLNTNFEQMVDNDNRTKRETKVDDSDYYENYEYDANSDSNTNSTDKIVFELQDDENDEVKSDLNSNRKEYVLFPNESTGTNEASLKIGDLESNENLTEVFSLIRPIQVNVYMNLLLNSLGKEAKKNKKSGR